MKKSCIVRGKKQRQGGFWSMELIITMVVGVTIIAGVIAAVFGRKSDTDEQSAIQMAATQITGALAHRYYAANRTYGPFTADAAGKALITTKGIDATMPWGGDTWTVSTAGNTTQVVLTFPTASARNPTEMASNLRTALAGKAMVTSAAGTGTDVVVTYGIPR